MMCIPSFSICYSEQRLLTLAISLHQNQCKLKTVPKDIIISVSEALLGYQGFFMGNLSIISKGQGMCHKKKNEAERLQMLI